MSASRIGQRLWVLVTPFPALIVGALIMREHDVPASRWGLNLIAGILGAAVCAVFLARSRPAMSKTAAIISASLAVGALAATFAMAGSLGVHRWIPLGPLNVHAGAIFLPLLIAALGGARRVRREAAVGAATPSDFRGDAFVVAARCSPSDRLCGGSVHFADCKQATRGRRVGGSIGYRCVGCVDMDAGRSAATCSIRRRHPGAGPSKRSSLAGRVYRGVSLIAGAVSCFAFEWSFRRRSGARRVFVHLHPGAAFRALPSAVARVWLVADRRLLRRGLL